MVRESQRAFQAKIQLQVGCTPFTLNTNTDLSFQLLPQQRLEGVTILGEFFDALMELVKRHGVLKEGPSELGLVVDVSDFGDGSGRSGCCHGGVSITKALGRDGGLPAVASSFFGTGTVSFLSSSKRLGEMVRKSTPAKALISPVYDGTVSISHVSGKDLQEHTLRKEAPMTMVL